MTTILYFLPMFVSLGPDTNTLIVELSIFVIIYLDLQMFDSYLVRQVPHNSD